ncbi:MAG TPA: glycosyltransferase family 39 protein [Puia sp.]|nr:glycosyltransferase family 39 protein [Puia sp.]
MKNSNRLIFFFALLKFVIPFLLQDPIYEPHRDELLYLAEARHMAWGFMEVPPLLSVFAWLTNILGGGTFWIKFWPSLVGAITFVVAAKTIRTMGGKSFAIFLCFLCFIFSAFLRVQFLFQPNFLEVFFWTMIAFSLVRYVQTEGNGWLYVFGVSAGLGMMSKYSAAFFVTSVVGGLLVAGPRKIFSNKHFWFASGLGLLIFLPNFAWQYVRHFPIVYHMKELQKNQLQYVNPIGFLFDQLAVNGPAMIVWIMSLIFLLFTKLGRPYRFVGLAYLFLLAILLIGRGKNYYTIGAYPILFAFGSFQLERRTTGRKSFVRYIVVAAILLTGYFYVPLMMPFFKPDKLAAYYRTTKMDKTVFLRWEDLKYHPLPQDFADMLGWKEMAAKAGNAYAMLDSSEKKNSIIFCDNYGEAGALDYYGRDYGIPEAYSDNASFLYWIPDSLSFENLVLVTDDRQEMTHPFIQDFQFAQVVDSVTNPYSREYGSLIILFKKGNASFQKMFKEKLAKDQAKVKW